MARRRKRSSRNTGAPSSTTTPIITYTVTVAHEQKSECDACAMPRAVLIEQQGGAWICEMCAGMVDHSGFYGLALINGVFNASGDGW
jgi:ribosomal protein L37AE/L43A